MNRACNVPRLVGVIPGTCVTASRGVEGSSMRVGGECRDGRDVLLPKGDSTAFGEPGHDLSARVRRCVGGIEEEGRRRRRLCLRR